VRVTRLRPDVPAQEIAEYCIAYVLREQRHVDAYVRNQQERKWNPVPPRCAADTVIGILGLGQIGARTATSFHRLGFQVVGWSRSPKSIEGIDCRHGLEELTGVIARSDFVVGILPSTPTTRGLFDGDRFAAMKPGSMLVNVGRGDLIIEQDLLRALDLRYLAGAVLDVHRIEPLPQGHPFWRHPKITITPHVSGWHLTGGLEDVAENYRRLIAGLSLLHEVNRAAGY